MNSARDGERQQVAEPQVPPVRRAGTPRQESDRPRRAATSTSPPAAPPEPPQRQPHHADREQSCIRRLDEARVEPGQGHIAQFALNSSDVELVGIEGALPNSSTNDVEPLTQEIAKNQIAVREC